MIQITPQMRILVAVEPTDFRRGIDGLARVCKEVLRHDPFNGWVFVFRNRPATALKVLVYDGQGFWLCHKRLSSGKFRWWPAPGASDASPEAGNDSQAASLPEPDPAPKRHPGHGRNGANAYTAAEKIEVPHPSLQPGDPCPKCETGTVYDSKRPGVVVRLVGQAPVGAKVYYLQKLRCNLCGAVSTPDLPPGVGEEKCLPRGHHAGSCRTRSSPRRRPW